MTGGEMDVQIKRFDSPDEQKTFAHGSFELITIAGVTLGRARYQPGWVWSEHVGKGLGKASCDVEHIGLVIAGRAMVKMDDGREIILSAGDLFYTPPGPPGHDSWVIGDEPYTSLHLVGAKEYAG
jgi:quercetin dioxygenase-like cupin family protein